MFCSSQPIIPNKDILSIKASLRASSLQHAYCAFSFEGENMITNYSQMEVRPQGGTKFAGKP